MLCFVILTIDQHPMAGIESNFSDYFVVQFFLYVALFAA